MEERITLRKHLEKILGCTTEEERSTQEDMLDIADFFKKAGDHESAKKVAIKSLEYGSETGEFQWVGDSEDFRITSCSIPLPALKDHIRRFYNSQQLQFKREYIEGEANVLDFTRKDDDSHGLEVSIKSKENDYQICVTTD